MIGLLIFRRFSMNVTAIIPSLMYRARQARIGEGKHLKPPCISLIHRYHVICLRQQGCSVGVHGIRNDGPADSDHTEDAAGPADGLLTLQEIVLG
jgi:hypothetical protein